MRPRVFWLCVSVFLAMVTIPGVAAEARYYQPTMGQWVSRDPIGYRGGPSLYECVGSTPVAAIDPLGLDRLFSGTISTMTVERDIQGLPFGGRPLSVTASGVITTPYVQSLPPSAAGMAISALNSLAATHQGFEYYKEDVTGLRQLIEQRLMPTMYQLDYSLVGSLPEDHRAEYRWAPGGGSSPYMAVMQGIDGPVAFHEAIHAYEHGLGLLRGDHAAWVAAGSPTDGGMAEDVTYGAVNMASNYIVQLQHLEQALKAEKPNYGDIAYYWRTAVPTTGKGPVFQAAERIRDDLGLQLSCQKLAAFYNDTQRWPNVGKWCIKFSCDAIPQGNEGVPAPATDGSHVFGFGQAPVGAFR